MTEQQATCTTELQIDQHPDWTEKLPENLSVEIEFTYEKVDFGVTGSPEWEEVEVQETNVVIFPQLTLWLHIHYADFSEQLQAACHEHLEGEF